MFDTTSRIRRSMLAVAVALTALGASLATANTASAARSYQNAQSFHCQGALIRVAPPRVWASHGTEQVAWAVVIQRYNGRRWYEYMRSTQFSSFNYYGQSVTSWSGGRYHNSTLNLRVSHRGHYRVGTVLGGSNFSSSYFIGNGSHCYIR